MDPVKGCYKLLLARVQPARSEAGKRGEKNMASKVGPWFSNTWWGKRTAKINLSLLIALLLLLLWKSF